MFMLWLAILLLVGLLTAVIPVGVACYILKMQVNNHATACANCGYPKHGSDSASCPECGFEWRSSARAQTKLWQEVAVLSVLVGIPMLAFILLVLLMIQIP